MRKLYQARITRVKNNIVFNFKFRCPIDKRDSFFNENNRVCFGACRKFMGEIEKTIPAKIDLEKMTVFEVEEN
jgi:hypothetical protein